MDSGLAAIIGAAIGASGALGASAVAARNARLDRDERRAQRWLDARRSAYAKYTATMKKHIDVSTVEVVLGELQNDMRMVELIAPDEIGEMAAEGWDAVATLELAVGNLARRTDSVSPEEHRQLIRHAEGRGDHAGDVCFKTVKMMALDLRQ